MECSMTFQSWKKATGRGKFLKSSTELKKIKCMEGSKKN